MRHRNSGRKLGRNASHRKALFKNMATALLTYGRITTTEAKAKEIRSIIEPLITLAQKDGLHFRRQAYQVLCNHKVVKRLFDEIGPEFKGIPGGYTRIVKLSMPRKGDCASMAIIELIRGQHLQAAGATSADTAMNEVKTTKKAPERNKSVRKSADKKADDASNVVKSTKTAAKKNSAKKEVESENAE